MTAAEKQKLLADTLAWVNEVRARHDLDPLVALRRGARGKARECPISRSLCGAHIGLVWVSPEHFAFNGPSGGWTALPATVKKFVREFDSGNIPELDVRVAA